MGDVFPSSGESYDGVPTLFELPQSVCYTFRRDVHIDDIYIECRARPRALFYINKKFKDK